MLLAMKPYKNPESPAIYLGPRNPETHTDRQDPILHLVQFTEIFPDDETVLSECKRMRCSRVVEQYSPNSYTLIVHPRSFCKQMCHIG